MDLTRLRLNLECIAGAVGTLIAIDVAPYFQYGADGKRTSTQLGYVYTLTSPYIGYEKLKLKIPGNIKKPIITSEEIKAQDSPIYVRCHGFECKIYRSSDQGYGLTATAESMEIVEPELEL